MTADEPSDHAGQANIARHVIGPRGEVQNVTASGEGPGGTGTRECREAPRPGAAGPEVEALDRFYRDLTWRGVIHPDGMGPGTPAMTAVGHGKARAIADGRSQERRRACGRVINHPFAETTSYCWTDRRLTDGGIPLGG